MTRQDPGDSAKDHLPPGTRMVFGGVFGLIIGLFLLGVGVVRMLVAAAGLGQISFQSGDLAAAAWYLVGAVASGTLGGLLRPLSRGYVASALTGMVAFQPMCWIIIAISENGVPSTFDFVGWMFMTVLFGPAIGIALLRREGWDGV